jgi:hypothetical protein
MFDPNGFPEGDGFWAFKGTSFRKVLLYAVMGLLLVVALAILGDTIGHHIRAVDSWIASLAFLPHQVVEVYFGYAGRHVAKIAGRHGSAIYVHDAVVFGGLILCIIVLVFITGTARRAVADAMTDAEAAQPS